MIGTLVVDGEICTILKVALRDHRIWFYAESIEQKDAEPTIAHELRLHGEDGKLILIVNSPTPVSRRVGGRLLIDLPVKLIDVIDGRPGDPHGRV